MGYKDCESSCKARRARLWAATRLSHPGIGWRILAGFCPAGRAPRSGRPGNHAAFEAGQMAPRNAEGAGGQIAKKRALEWVDGKEDPNRYCLSYLAYIPE